MVLASPSSRFVLACLLPAFSHRAPAAVPIGETIPDLEVGPAKVTVVTLPPSRGGKPPTGRAIEVPVQVQAGK